VSASAGTTGTPALDAYRAAVKAQKEARAAAAAEVGVPICARCGEPCIDGFNSMTEWGAENPRCNPCASKR
jgi:hypothetical protein